MTSHLEELFDSYTIDVRLWRRGRNVLASIAACGWVACALAFRLDPARFHASYLVAYAFFLTLTLGALFFVMLQHLTGAAWSVTMRRMAENAMVLLPLGVALFVPIALGLPSLYEWARPEAVAADPILQGKAAFLNPRFFLVRTAFYFALWSLWAWKLYRNSVRGTGLRACQSSQRWSAPGMIMLTVTVAMASFDWLMSLDPHWYSTMFGVYVYSGAALAFIAALILILLALRGADVLRYSVNHEHYHDLGKWLFALTVFWAYIAFSQYMLIWYANLPEETAWFRDRLVGSWRGVSMLLVVGHFLVPFFVLISRAAKRKLGLLAAAAAWVLFMQYTDLYWIAMPIFSKSGVTPHWIDLAALAAVGGTFALAFWWRLRAHPLAPVNDIRFEKALEFTNV
ncbi:MAG TPA: hypothetical protein VN893_12110 [Bryobacteraceae bacterium]|nr:hypothetical protein [Bryobacteraceae bacterium]